MGGIHHAEDAFRPGRILTQVEQDIPRDALVGGVCTEAVTSRQVEQLDLFSMLSDELPRFLFDGHAGVVGDLLTQAGEGVEERGLP